MARLNATKVIPVRVDGYFLPPRRGAMEIARNLRRRVAFIALIVVGALLTFSNAQAAVQSAAPPEVVRVGVLSFRGKEVTVKRWTPTADYLTRAIAGTRFEIVPLGLEEITSAIEARRIDFLLTNSGNYINLESPYGISRIATMYSLGANKTIISEFGAVIFTRKNRDDIATLRDLRGKKFLAVARHGFGGYLMAAREFYDRLIDPEHDFSALNFSGAPQDLVVYAVEAGAADAGTVRTGVLENMAADGKIDLADFKVLNPQHIAGFPYLLSTRLYPEWPFSKLRDTDQVLAQKVAIALLSMKPGAPAARAGDYGGWTVPLDYQRVHNLYLDLHLGPYAKFGDISFKKVFYKYEEWIFMAVAILVIAIAWGARVEHLVQERTAALSRANETLEREIRVRKQAEEEARRHQHDLAHITRLHTMGQMATSLAHEINQPLAAITNYAKGAVRRLTGENEADKQIKGALERIAQQAERAAEVVKRIRAFVGKGPPAMVALDINDIIRNTADFLGAEAARNRCDIRLILTAKLPPVRADRVQLEQVLLNLGTNAIESMVNDGVKERTIRFKTRIAPDGWVAVSVADTGYALDEKDIEKIFEPFYTSKKNGLGMGLSISRSIIESFGGTLNVKKQPDGGAEFTFRLPPARGKML